MKVARSHRQATKWDLLEIIRALGGNPSARVPSEALASEAIRLARTLVRDLAEARAELDVRRGRR